VKAGMEKLPMYTKNTSKRLILDSVIFDPIGRILVKVDGTLPMTEVVRNLELNVSVSLDLWINIEPEANLIYIINS